MYVLGVVDPLTQSTQLGIDLYIHALDLVRDIISKLVSSSKGFKSCFGNALINYRQTRSDDRFTLVKMNITRSRNVDYK